MCIFFSSMNLYAGFFFKSSARYRLSAPGNFVSRYDHVLVLKGRTFPFFFGSSIDAEKGVLEPWLTLTVLTRLSLIHANHSVNFESKSRNI